MLCQPSSRRRPFTPSLARTRAGAGISYVVSKRNPRCRSRPASRRTPGKTRSESDESPTKLAPGYVSNQQYSVNALTDSSGTIKERYAYDAYGNLSIFDGSGAARTSTAEGNRYTYTGREWDKDLDLYHYRARMYDATAGRFCSRDPIGFDDGPNLFAYVHNRPISFVDPRGLYSTPGYGHFCGPRNGEEWDGVTELDCIDKACKWHDECIGPLGTQYPCRITYCDQSLSINAYYCAIYGCNTAACRAAALVIAPWMDIQGGGTLPIGWPFFK
ncbi:RHS repeat-associated core domain-containing protein [Stieleria tagensis]|uniref:RHS repeat-associated core domain-containing protein n=1 Tax=Stieleria tagensis TaxID=2956795 RepID=UPI00209ABFFA|nr:RHS repeat-associated core domain-containing protein [Stieleria tagensis]